MATSVGLNFRLTAAVDRFESSMRDVERRLGGIEKASKQTASGMRLLAAIEIGRTILSGLSAIGGIMQSVASSATEMFNASREATDAVGKLAASTGMAHEPLQILARVADHSGLSATQFGDALQKLSRGLGEAANGTGTAKRALEQLGIPIDSLIGMAPEQQFMRIAAAIGEIEDPTKKSTLAADLFGRSGTKLIPMFTDLEESVKGTAAEMLDLGQVLSGTQITNVEKMNDRFSDVTRTVSGLRDQIVANIAPALTSMADDALALVKAFEYNGSTGGQALANYLTEAFLNGAKVLADWAEFILNGLKDFLSGFSSVIADLLAALAGLADWIPGVSEETVDGLNAAAKSADDFAETLDGFTFDFSGYVKEAIDSFAASTNEAADNTKKFVDGIGQAADKTKETGIEASLFAKELQYLQSTAKDSDRAIGELADQADRTWMPLSEVKSTGSAAADAMAAIAIEAANLAGENRLTSHEVNQLGVAAKNASKGIGEFSDPSKPAFDAELLGERWTEFSQTAGWFNQQIRDYMKAWEAQADRSMDQYIKDGYDPQWLKSMREMERQQVKAALEAQKNRVWDIIERNNQKYSMLNGEAKRIARENITRIREEWRDDQLDMWRDINESGNLEDLFPGSGEDNSGLEDELASQTSVLTEIRDRLNFTSVTLPA